MAILLFIMVFFNDSMLYVVKKCGFFKEEEEAEVDENLGTYTKCLGRFNRKAWKIEELHMRKNLGIRTLDDEMMMDLKNKQIHNKIIRTCHNYSITTNPKYAAMFQYTPIEMRDTEEE